MAAWETLLAALGGLVLGFGLGLFVGAKRERNLTRDIRRLRMRTRASIMPILEGRAQQLGLPTKLRGYDTEDPLEAAVDLSNTIIEYQEEQDLAFSDTVELARAELGKDESPS